MPASGICPTKCSTTIRPREAKGDRSSRLNKRQDDRRKILKILWQARGETGVDVAGAIGGPKALQLLDHLGAAAPIGRGEAHALAGRAVEAVGAERSESLEGGQRAVERRRDVLDGECRERPAQALEHGRLEALDVDLAEGRQPMRG